MKEKDTRYHSGLTTNDYTPNEQSLEEKVATLLATNSPIEAISPAMFTERKEGVLPETDIRTDRFELAVEAGDKIQASMLAQRHGANQESETPKSDE